MPEHSNTLRGRWLLFLRVAWVMVAVLVVGLVVAGAPEYYHQLHTLSAPDIGDPAAARADLRESGLSVDFYTAYLLALDVAFSAGSLAVSALIFWRKSAEPVAFLVALMLVTLGADSLTVEALAADYPIADWLGKGLSFVGGVCLVLFFYLFPDGRFVPRWTRWLMVVGIGLTVAQTFFPNTPLGWNIPVFGILISGVFAQIYRYRRFSGPVQRRQTKWVVFGVTVGITGFLVTITLPPFFLDSHTGNDTLGDLVGNTVIGLFVFLIPLSIAVAVLRSRLFDIDVIINRTLVYGSLTASLVLLYVGGVVALQYVFRALTGGGSSLAVVASTLLIAALFSPLRRRVQEFIDRRFYRRKYDAAQVLAAFSARLRDETDLDTLNDDLVAVVGKTMQPEHVSLWLRESRREADG